MGVYSASLKAENIIEAIGMTAPDKLDIGAIQLVNETEYGSEEERLGIIKGNIEVMVEIMKGIGY